MSDRSDALQSALKKIAADLAARGPVPYVWLPQLNERDRPGYRLRKQLPEPVFGQIKQARGFRQFLLRGFEKVRAEWAIVCTNPRNATKDCRYCFDECRRTNVVLFSTPIAIGGCASGGVTLR
jgi:Transposase DDE domain